MSEKHFRNELGDCDWIGRARSTTSFAILTTWIKVRPAERHAASPLLSVVDLPNIAHSPWISGCIGDLISGALFPFSRIRIIRPLDILAVAIT